MSYQITSNKNRVLKIDHDLIENNQIIDFISDVAPYIKVNTITVQIYLDKPILHIVPAVKTSHFKGILVDDNLIGLNNNKVKIKVFRKAIMLTGCKSVDEINMLLQYIKLKYLHDISINNLKICCFYKKSNLVSKY